MTFLSTCGCKEACFLRPIYEYKSCCFFPAAQFFFFLQNRRHCGVQMQCGHGTPLFVSGASGLPAGSERAGGETGPGRQLRGGGVWLLTGYPVANIGWAGGGIGTGGGVGNPFRLQRRRHDLGRRQDMDWLWQPRRLRW